MNALEIAECFELYACDHKPDGWPAIRQGTLDEAAAMLRRQHEAIVKLREALGDVMKLNNGEPEFVHAFKVLNETMEIAK